mgnify:CR=1 FL=1|jgi:hypothetical protein|tara:strand:- start:316 stop:582 length:267 start_codon:yes stop_codon:yes gene_type:complete
MSEEVKEILPGIIDILEDLKEPNEFSFFSWDTDLDVNEQDSIVMENLSQKKDKSNKHIVNSIHHFEDCLYKLGYDLSDIIPSSFEEGN